MNRLRVQRRAAERAAYERENPVVSVRMPAEWVEWLESEAERRGVASAVLLREATMLLRRAYGGLPHDVEFNLEPACHGTDVSPHEVAQSPDR